MVLHRAGAVDYPTSDGRPMGETDRHRKQMYDLIDALQRRYDGRDDVYVTGNLLLFYEPGDGLKHVSPDVMVVFGVHPGDRQGFRIWDEKAVPAVVIEVTSKSTRREDTVVKKKRYLELGVQEYYLYDPTGDYLDPPLQGWHASQGAWVRVHDRAVHSPALSVGLRIIDDQLRLLDSETGQVLPTTAEAERQRADAEHQRADEEHQRADEEHQRADEERRRREAAEEELRRLRTLLAEGQT